MSNRFANEETPSNYSYPQAYDIPMPIEEQIERIATVFALNPKRALTNARNLRKLPEEAEGWFAVPNVEALTMNYFPEILDPGKEYCHAIKLVLAKLADSRLFCKYRGVSIASVCMRRNMHTARMFEFLVKVQESDILLIPAQLGMRHRGRSVRRVHEVFTQSEYGLGILEIGFILLTHPERLVSRESLGIDCAGDEFSPDADDNFLSIPSFMFSFGLLVLGVAPSNGVAAGFGSASGFLA